MSMRKKLRQDAESIVRQAINSIRPDRAVACALADKAFPGRVFLAAAGKAAWQMAGAALRTLRQPVAQGIVVTKYGHVRHALPPLVCFEGGHPVPDENGIRGTQAVLDMTERLRPEDTVLFLLSGGGSALFEKPLISLEELQDITGRLLAGGAGIMEINTLRKHLSEVKGGRFAQWCDPAHVHTLVLSDVLGDSLDMIASGPAAADSTTSGQAQEIARRYGLVLSAAACRALERETPKRITNVTAEIIGSVRELCRAAQEICREMGYLPTLLTDRLDCEARDAGRQLAEVLKAHSGDGRRLAYIAGGETVVHLTGKGMGGRNQELALSAAAALAGIPNAALISVGSDGTDGPTDAAGGYVDGGTMETLERQGIDYQAAMAENDSYHALGAIGNLIITGPTETNVNDIAVGLIG